MKKLTKQFLCLILVLAMVAAVPFGVAATVPMGMELYSMELTNETISLYGRQFLKSGDEVVLTKGNTCLATAESAVDGTFTMEASVAPSGLSLSVDGKTAGVVDTSCFKSLFALMGTEYHSFALKAEYGRFVFSGAHKGKDVRYVTMNMVDTDGAPAAAVETKSDADGNFSMEFYVKPGVYTMQLKARNLAMVSCSLDLRNFCMAPAETETIALLQQLEGYLAELEILKEQCVQAGISTEYETINIEMIRKFIGYIHEELAKGYTGSLGQYKFGLTRLYNQAKESMTAYLSGEAEPFSVPQYVTSDLTFDGTRVWADTMQYGERSRNLVYFNGFGHFDTANNDTEFFNKIGLNLIQSSMPSMAGCLQTDDWPDDWNGVRRGGSTATFTETNESAIEGEYSLRAENSDGWEQNKGIYISQVVSVKPNTEYVYGFQAKGKAIRSSALVSCVGDVYVSEKKDIPPTEDWTEYQYTYQTGENETTMAINFLIQNIIEEMYLDDVYIKEKGTDINLLKNGDFEKAARPLTELDREAMAEGYYIRYNSVENFRRILSEAEKNNVLVDVGVFPHFFPSFLEQGTQEDYTDDGLNEMHFTPFELDNERVRKAISIYARLVCSIVSEYDCVRTICLLNEPGLLANKVTETKDLKAHYTPLWQEFLMDRYGNDVRKLNENYGSNYQNFSEVDMPDNMEATPLYYDYRCFNDGVLADFHQWFAEELHNAYPQYKLHSKVQQYFRKSYETMHERGTNYELLAPFLDINGCDSFPTYASLYNRLSYKMAYYDFLTSLKKAPVWDTESHIIYDGGKINYYSDQTAHVEADVWNGAVHGRSGGAYWLWDRGDSSSPWGAARYAQPNYAFRPEEAATLARTNMDLNRLSNEVSVLQNSKAKTAILYSRTALGYGGEASMTSMLDAYESLIFSGQNVDFVTDTTIETIGNYQLLIIPDATHVKADMLSTIKKYLEQGGTLYIKGSDSLKKTEYNKNQETTLVSAIYNHPNTVTDGEESLKTTVNRLALSKLRLVDAETNEDIENVEWFYTEKDGRCLIHVMNHEANTTKQVKVLYEDKPVESLKELRSGKMADQFSAEFYQPLLVSFRLIAFDLVDENGTVLEQDINGLKQGLIRCRTAVEGDLILAIYRDDTMLQAVINNDTIAFTPEENSNYRMMATVWELNTLTPLTQQRTMTYQIEEVQQ